MMHYISDGYKTLRKTHSFEKIATKQTYQNLISLTVDICFFKKKYSKFVCLLISKPVL